MTEQVKYEDFDLTISTVGENYFVQVNKSPVGSSERVAVRRPFPNVSLETLLLRLENAVLRGKGLHRGPMVKEEGILRDFGSEMYKIVFREAPVVASLFAGSVAYVNERSVGLEGLRLKLRIEPPELAVLPWEYLYDELEDSYFCLKNKSPLVRFLPASGLSSPLTIKGPFNILGMISNPGGKEWPLLDTEKERRRIDEVIASLPPGSQVNFKWVKGGTAEHLLDIMQQESWHAFHFIGHGGTEQFRYADDSETNIQSEGFIVFEDGFGGAEKITAPDLGLLLQGKGSLRLAVLNCCESARGAGQSVFSSMGASLVRSTVPVVVAMQFAITDDAATQFARQFYRSLISVESVEKAVTLARIIMKRSSNVEWAIPVMFTRAESGTLFALERPTASPDVSGIRNALVNAAPKRNEAQEELRRLFR